MNAKLEKAKAFIKANATALIIGAVAGLIIGLLF